MTTTLSYNKDPINVGDIVWQTLSTDDSVELLPLKVIDLNPKFVVVATFLDDKLIIKNEVGQNLHTNPKTLLQEKWSDFKNLYENIIPQRIRQYEILLNNLDDIIANNRMRDFVYGQEFNVNDAEI